LFAGAVENVVGELVRGVAPQCAGGAAGRGVKLCGLGAVIDRDDEAAPQD
jgi:hypothetical protein